MHALDPDIAPGTWIAHYLYLSKLGGRVKWMSRNMPPLLPDETYAVTLPFNLHFNYNVVTVFRYASVSALMFVSTRC